MFAGAAFGVGHHCPKYRRRVLGGRVARRLDELIVQIADEHGWQIVAHEVYARSRAPIRAGRTYRFRRRRWCGRSKGRTARVLRDEFPHLRRFAKVLWSPSYFAGLGRLRLGVDGAPLYRAPVGRGAGVMSQQVTITRARLHGSAVYLGDITGPDGATAPVWSANPDEVVSWLCDGFRFRFNQRRSTRCRYVTCEDRNGDRVMVIDPSGEPVLAPIGRTVTDITDAQASRN